MGNGRFNFGNRSPGLCISFPAEASLHASFPAKEGKDQRHGRGTWQAGLQAPIAKQAHIANATSTPAIGMYLIIQTSIPVVYVYQYM